MDEFYGTEFVDVCYTKEEGHEDSINVDDFQRICQRIKSERDQEQQNITNDSNKDRLFHCGVCKKSFVSRVDMSNHTLSHPTKDLVTNREKKAMLIELIKTKYKSLYDIKDPKYKDINFRNSIWKEISKRIKVDSETPKRWWRCLRDQYTRTKRNNRNKVKSMEGNGSLLGSLTFLDAFSYEKSILNVAGDSDPPSSPEIVNEESRDSPQTLTPAEESVSQDLTPGISYSPAKEVRSQDSMPTSIVSPVKRIKSEDPSLTSIIALASRAPVEESEQERSSSFVASGHKHRCFDELTGVIKSAETSKQNFYEEMMKMIRRPCTFGQYIDDTLQQMPLAIRMRAQRGILDVLMRNQAKVREEED